MDEIINDYRRADFYMPDKPFYRWDETKPSGGEDALILKDFKGADSMSGGMQQNLGPLASNFSQIFRPLNNPFNDVGGNNNGYYSTSYSRRNRSY